MEKIKLTQHEKNIKKFGKPRFKDGDIVHTSFTDIGLLTVDGEPQFNGYSWMYFFKETDARIGEQYLTINK